MRKQFTTHIDLPSGPRFQTHDSEEALRADMVEFWNEVLADGEDDKLPLDTDFDTVEEKIEELHNLSWEETWIPEEKVWVLVVDDHSGGTSIEMHKTRREALHSVGNVYDPKTDTSAMSDDDLSSRLIDVLDNQHNASWFVLEEKEIPS